jgi:hypothetical protein
MITQRLIDGFQMLRKLAKKHGLSNEKREKTVMYVEDLVEIEQTNLTTTKKKYSHAGTGYRLLSSSSWLDSLRIDHKRSLTSATVTLWLPFFGTPKVGLTGSYWNSHTNSRRNSSAAKMRRLTPALFFFFSDHKFSSFICCEKLC